MKKKKIATATAILLCLISGAHATQTTSGYDTQSGPLIFANNGTEVGIWNTSQLLVIGGVQMGFDSSACGAANEGEQRYNTSIHNFEFCNGVAWVPFGAKSVAISFYPSYSPGGGVGFDIGLHDYCALSGNWQNGGDFAIPEQQVIPNYISGTKHDWTFANAWNYGSAICFDFN